MVQFNSNIEAIISYIRDRFQLWKFVSLTTILYLGYLLNSNFVRIGAFPWIVLFLLVFSFRLFDDLFDIPRDTIQHPDRFLVNYPQPKVFKILLSFLLLIICGILLIGHYFLSIMLFLAILCFYYFWYAVLRNRVNNQMVHIIIVLLKYPLFVYLMAPDTTKISLLSILFLTFLLFEIQDDPDLKKDTIARKLFLVCLPGYFGMFFILLSFSSHSLIHLLPLALATLLQSAVLLNKTSYTPFIPFINTTILFVFLTGRYFLI